MGLENVQSMFRFKNINYEAVDSSVEEGSNIHYRYKDTIVSKKYTNSNSTVIIKRSLYFEPSILYKLDITLEFLVTYEDTNIDSYDETDLDDLILEHLHSSSGFERLSALIANISSAQGNTPIITNTNFTEN